MKKLIALKFLFLLGTFMFLALFWTVDKTPTYASTVLFQDNFESGSASQWTNLSGNGLWQVKNINGSMMYGARIDTPSTIIDSVAANVNSPNYQIDFDYLPIVGADRNFDFRYRRNSPAEGYNPYEVHFINSDYVWTNFGYPSFTSSSPLINGQINHVTIILEDRHIQFILNGTKIVDYIDSTYNFTGDEKIGLRIGTGSIFPTEAWIDNIVATSIDSPTTTPTATPTPTPTPTSTPYPTPSPTLPPSQDLSVPLLKQTSNPWQTQIYDYAKKWSPSDSTINSWGCALTSATMILKYHGINYLPNKTTLNPGTLNTWLKSQKDGYLGTGWINWLAISRLSKLAKPINNITSFDALQYVKTNGEDKNKLTADINNSLPDILEVPGHFIVAKGINGTTFNINDPYYNRSTLNDYSNTFLSLGTYTPSFTDLSYIMLTTNPGINTVLKDYNNITVGESYVQQPITNDNNPYQKNFPLKIFYLSKPNNGNYTLQINSGDKKNYDINVYFYNKDGDVKITNIKGDLYNNNQDSLILNFDKNKLKNDSIKHKSKEKYFEEEIDELKNGLRIYFEDFWGVSSFAK